MSKSVKGPDFSTHFSTLKISGLLGIDLALVGST